MKHIFLFLLIMNKNEHFVIDTEVKCGINNEYRRVVITTYALPDDKYGVATYIYVTYPDPYVDRTTFDNLDSAKIFIKKFVNLGVKDIRNISELDKKIDCILH